MPTTSFRSPDTTNRLSIRWLLMALLVLGATPPAWGQVVINEVDYDQPGTDAAEFVELKNTGLVAENLDLYTLELVNGTGGGAAVYDTIDLPNVNLAPGDYYVVCANAATVANCDLDDGPDTNFIQNGAPDAVGLRLSGALVDAVSYEGDTGAPYTEGSGSGLEDNPGTADSGISRCADGTDTDQNNADFTFTAITPGAANDCPGPTLVVNEIDYDQPGTDTAEFVEIKNVGSSPVALGGITLELVNGSGGGAAVYDSIALPAVSLAAGDYFVVCANAATVANCDLDDGPDTNFIQNGAPDAVALRQGATIIDTVSYEGNTGAPYTEGSGSGLEDDPSSADMSISRCPDGADTDVNNVDLVYVGITPGATNDCVVAVPEIVINEIMQNPSAVSDSNGEWLEVFNPGAAAVDIDGWTLRDDDFDSHTIANGGPLLVPAGGFLVLGRNADFGTNGGVVVDYEYSSFFLANGGDEVVLVDTFSTEVDRVNYDGGPLFPDPNGASMALANPLLDNNVGANWCTSSTPFGDGDSGTPGAVNDCPSPDLVINEIMQNPSVVSDSSGEWLEIFNPNASPIDINGWTLRDDDFDSHTIANGGPLLVPAGGYLVLGNNSDSGTNGGVTVAYEYSGFFLANGADEVVLVDTLANEVDRVSYDGGPAFPDPNGASMALEIPSLDNDVGANWCTSSTPFGLGDSGTPGAINDCPGIEIYEIQGSGASSPFESSAVITRDNVVTGVRTNGFFIQTPTARDDFDAATSNGIFVFTSSAPGVAEGDLVDVVGTVVEFFGFTEFDDDGLTVTVTGSGSQPAPVLLGPSTPDPGPFDPPDMERLEGMLVELAGGIATGPTDPFGDTAVVVGPGRTFREPGIEFPGIFGLPEWDGNQEVFEVDPDGLAGQPDADIFATQAVVSAIGPLAFSFGDYQILPKTLVLGPAPTVLDPVRARDPGEFTVGSFNLFRLNGGFAKLSAYVTGVLDSPDILAVQEVFDIDDLEDLADQIALDGGPAYAAWLIEGNDPGGIDVGFLTGPDIQVDSITQVDPDATFINPVTMEENILHDRPPLLLEGSCELEFGSFPIAVMAVHNRSLGSIEDPVQGVRVRKKRHLQAVSIAEKVDELQTADPDVRLVVTGDFNAFEFTDGYADAVGVITGDFVPADSLVCDEDPALCTGLPDNDLLDEVFGLPAAERYSFVFDGNAQVLDHALTSVGINAEISGFEYGRGNADAYADLLSDVTPANLPLRSSDHDGLVLYVLKDEDADGVPNDDDVCAGTVIPENVPTSGLKPNRYALVDGDGTFDTITPPGGGPGDVFTLGDTAGCSCEQIIIAQGLGNGHVKHGCSVGAMRNWVDLVNP